MKKKKKSVKVRRQWKVRPATKVKESDKRYRRSQAKRELRKEWEEL